LPIFRLFQLKIGAPLAEMAAGAKSDVKEPGRRQAFAAVRIFFDQPVSTGSENALENFQAKHALVKAGKGTFSHEENTKQRETEEPISLGQIRKQFSRSMRALTERICEALPVEPKPDILTEGRLWLSNRRNGDGRL
jgi:hypothetical protein